MPDAIGNQAFRLSCQNCLRFLGRTEEMMQLVRLFKPSERTVVPRGHAREWRAKCYRCGYVNIFHPLCLTREQLVHIV